MKRKSMLPMITFDTCVHSDSVYTKTPKQSWETFAVGLDIDASGAIHTAGIFWRRKDWNFGMLLLGMAQTLHSDNPDVMQAEDNQ
jgi:hypothetical protein